jgi:hypothetical protein
VRFLGVPRRIFQLATNSSSESDKPFFNPHVQAILNDLFTRIMLGFTNGYRFRLTDL